MRAPSASSRSAEPERLVAERLPCLATAQPAPAAIRAAVVDTLKVRAPAARAGGVEQVGALDGHVRGELAHRARQPGELLDRLALGAQRDQKPGDLSLGRLAVHDLGEHLRGLVGAQVASPGERVDRAGQDRVGHLTRLRRGPTGRCARLQARDAAVEEVGQQLAALAR